MQKLFLHTVGKSILVLILVFTAAIPAVCQETMCGTTSNQYCNNYQGSVVNNNYNRILLLSCEQSWKYLSFYREEFPDNKYTHSIFFHKEYFIFFGKFFNDIANKDYKGLALHFMTYNSTSVNHTARYPNQITLAFFAIDKSGKIDSFKLKNYYDTNKAYFDSIFGNQYKTGANHGDLCPHYCDFTTDEGHAIAFRKSGKQRADKFDFSKIFLTPEQARTFPRNYRSQNGQTVHTPAIFLDKLNFKFLGDFFESEEMKEKAGVRLFFAVYKENNAIDNQRVPRQISLFMTATDDKTEPCFGAFAYYYNNNSTKYTDLHLKKGAANY